MSCHHREDVCQYCMEKLETTTEDSQPPKRVFPPEKLKKDIQKLLKAQKIPCRHTEDVCQNCLEKVQTEEAPKRKSPPGKTIREKRISILFDSSLLAAAGYAAYYSGKFFLKIFDFSVSVASDLLKNITTRTLKE